MKQPIAIVRYIAVPYLSRNIRTTSFRLAVCLSICVLLPVSCARGQQQTSADNTQELAKQLSNPVASLISVPIQTNYDFNVGDFSDGFRFTTNIQPVIPIALTPKLNLITRNILPVTHQSDVFAGLGDQSGLGDLTSSFFLSPSGPVKGLIVGAGPVFLLPTATNKYLGTGKWGVGPTLVVLKQHGPWTAGGLYNHIFSFTGQSARSDVSQTFFQPFLTYTYPNTTTLGINMESTYDFAGGAGWTVPINVFASKIFKLGSQLTNFQIGGRYYAAAPSAAPDWGLRFTTTLLFPKKPK
jgi:hypothetical protein